MLYGMDTVPMTSSHVKKREVTEMNIMRHMLTEHVRNDTTRLRLKVQNITVRCCKMFHLYLVVTWHRSDPVVIPAHD